MDHGSLSQESNSIEDINIRELIRIIEIRTEEKFKRQIELLREEIRILRSTREQQHSSFIENVERNGNTQSELNGDEFIRIIQNLEIFNVKDINYIIRLAKELSLWNVKDEEKFKFGAKLYIEKSGILDFEVRWEMKDYTGREIEGKVRQVNQNRLLKQLNRQNPVAYSEIIGESKDSTITDEQVSQVGPIVKKYIITEPFYITDLFRFLMRKRYYLSKREVIEKILPLMSKCIRFYISKTGVSCCVFKLNRDNPCERMKSDFARRQYRIEAQIKYEDDIECKTKNLNIFDWGRQIASLRCDESFLRYFEESRQEKLPEAATMRHEMEITVEKQNIEFVDVDTVWIHGTTLYDSYNKWNGEENYTSYVDYSRNFLNKKSKWFENIGRKKFNDIRNIAYKILSPLWDKIRVKDEDDTILLGECITKNIK